MINDTVRWLQQMHHQHEFSDELIQPDRFEDDFKRELGVGDEWQEQSVIIYQDWDESGHGRGDFC